MLYILRIAVVTTSYPRFLGDPSGHFVAAEVALMAQRGDAVRVICPEGRFEAAFGWPGFAARARSRPLTRIPLAAAWVREARARSSPWRGRAFDRVIAHWAVPCAAPIALGGDVPLTVVSHGGDVRLLEALPLVVRSAIARRIARRAESWQFVSEGLLASLLGALAPDTADVVRSVARVEAPRITMPDVARALAARRRELGDARVSVCVARLVPAKRVDLAIADAAARGRELVVVGDGPERARLEATAKRSGARVRFVGRTTREDALTWIGAADEVVLASRAEGLSTVVREADALGVSVRRIG